MKLQQLWRLTGVAGVVFLASGCVSYEADPLEPFAELSALEERSLSGIIAEHARPGDAGEAPRLSFDPADGLDEDELVAVALTLNPDLKVKRLEIGEGQALLIARGQWPNPEIGVAFRPSLSGGSGVEVEGDLLWQLLRPWERAAGKRAARARIDEIDAEIVAAEWKLVEEVRSQLATLLFTEQFVSLLDEERGLRERALGLLERRRELGEGTELDVAVAELDLAEVERDRRRAQTDLESARRELNRLLGLPPSFALPLVDTQLAVTVFEALTDEEIDDRLLSGRFELRAKEAAYRRAEEELRVAVYRQYPFPKVGGSFEDSPENTSLGPAVSLEIPIFHQNQGEISQKRNARARRREEYVALLHRLKAAAHEAHARLERARLEVETQETEIRPLIRRSQDLFERAFRAREVSVSDWLMAQHRTLEARKSYLDSVMRYKTAAIRLEAATGTRLGNSGGSTQQKTNSSQ